MLISSGGLWHRVFMETESIAANHTSAVGCRTLAVWRVAPAKLVGVTELCTFDTRQTDLVKIVGMTVVSPWGNAADRGDSDPIGSERLCPRWWNSLSAKVFWPKHTL